jgi:hypothetical protein
MKKKALKLRLSSFFGQQIHSAASSGHIPELIKPESEGERAESVMKVILSWADDGEKMLDFGNRTSKSIPDATWERSNKR